MIMDTIKLTKAPKKILIVKPSSLGDVVHSLPFLNAVKTCFPQAAIHWVIAKGLEGLLEEHPMIDKLWIIHKDTWKKMKQVKSTLSEIRELFRALKKEKYDLVIDLQGLLRSGIITVATGARIRIGFKEAREGSSLLYTHKVTVGKDIHAVDRYLKIAAFLGCDITEVHFPLYFNSSLITHHSSLSEDYAVMVPGARWTTKKWPAERFGELSSLLPVKSIIVGSRSDVNIANEIVSLSNGKSISLAGKTNLNQLIEVIRGAKFVISNDSGPMHIAAGLGIPVFAIFGPTDPLRTGPYGEWHTIIKEDTSCAPCFKKTCDDMKCLKSLSAEKVYKIIESANKRTEA
jgi:heptosyltransferase I